MYLEFETKEKTLASEPLAKLAFSILDLEIRFFCSKIVFLKPRFELRNPIFLF
jgi:hypothetical protein